MTLAKVRMSRATRERTPRNEREPLWQQARTLLQRSAAVFSAATQDPVLEAEAVELLQTTQAALRMCEQALQGVPSA